MFIEFDGDLVNAWNIKYITKTKSYGGDWVIRAVLTKDIHLEEQFDNLDHDAWMERFDELAKLLGVTSET